MVHEAGHLDIEFTQPTRVVRRERDIDTVVDIRPLRMMAVRLSVERDAVHESKSRVEILENKASCNGISAVYKLPTLKAAKMRHTLLRS